MSDDPTITRDNLAPAHRAIVDQALAAGELRGPLTLRTVERDLARHRLYQHPTPRRRATLAAIVAVLPYLGLAFATTRPTWLVAVTIAATPASTALITRTLRRGDDLDPDERRHLQTLARSHP